MTVDDAKRDIFFLESYSDIETHDASHIHSIPSAARSTSNHTHQGLQYVRCDKKTKTLKIKIQFFPIH